MVRPARLDEDALDAARVPAQGLDQRPAASVVAVHRGSVLRADRRQRAGAQGDPRRKGSVGARLSISVRVRRRGEALGLQRSDQLGRRARALASKRASQQRDGRDAPGRVPQLPQDPPPVMNGQLWAALSEIQDPEMPVNLVDLGVIYAVDEHDGIVDVDLTFTAMGCPASEFILDDVRERLMREPGVKEVRVNVVWDPPWTVAKMTQAGRDSLEAWGLAV